MGQGEPALAAEGYEARSKDALRGQSPRCSIVVWTAWRPSPSRSWVFPQPLKTVPGTDCQDTA